MYIPGTYVECTRSCVHAHKVQKQKPRISCILASYLNHYASSELVLMLLVIVNVYCCTWILEVDDVCLALVHSPPLPHSLKLESQLRGPCWPLSWLQAGLGGSDVTAHSSLIQRGTACNLKGGQLLCSWHRLSAACWASTGETDRRASRPPARLS